MVNANLTDANLSLLTLWLAELRKGATLTGAKMPDGSIHE